MLKLFKYILWIVLVIAIATGLDQLLVRVPLNTPGINQTQTFYVDFRARLLGLLTGDAHTQQDAIEKVIGTASKTETLAPSESTRYLYVDDNGALQFADSLQQVPFKYRNSAQPLAE